MWFICCLLLAGGSWHCAACGVAWRRVHFGAVACRAARCGVTWRRVLLGVVHIGAVWRGVVMCKTTCGAVYCNARSFVSPIAGELT